MTATMLISLATILVPVPSFANTPSWIGSSSSCSEQVQKIKIDAPSATSDEKIQKKCDSSLRLSPDKERKYELGDREIKGTCRASYAFLNVRHAFYSNSNDVCRRIEAARARSSGQIAQESAGVVMAEAKSAVSGMIGAVNADISKAEMVRSKALQLARDEMQKYSEKSEKSQEQEQKAKRLLKKASESKSVGSKVSRDRQTAEALKLSTDLKVVGENIAASIELLRFTTQLRSDLPELQRTAQTLGIDSQVVSNDREQLRSIPDNTKAPGGSAISGALGSALPFAPLALGAAGLMMQQKNAADAAAAASANQAPAYTPPSDYDLSSAKSPATTSLGEITKSTALGGNPNSGTSMLKKEEGERTIAMTGYEGYAPPPGEFESGAGSTESEFSGALGNSPIFGSASSAGAGGNASPKAGKLDELLELSPPIINNGSTAMITGGGGAPAFTGGSSSMEGDSFKDIFKVDPIAMPGGASAGLEPFTAEAFTGIDSAGLAHDSLKGSNPIPGAHDFRSLFVRVKELHIRCQKKGCVTTEDGGKI